MRITEFERWLLNNQVSVHPDSISSYRSYLQQVESGLNINLDNVPLAQLDIVIADVNNLNFPENANKTLSNYKSAVRKYFEFRNAI